jgi:hypothetical protein
MSAPITIVVLASGSHLAARNAATALCGESVERPLGVFELEPGSDVGERKGDCKRCVHAWRAA